ncbi:hypothetical protein OTK49_20905 [Vibrio coralliirubri]|uniref:hypothetical protein n=1 Tax=Vibrio coralliirubri TaxID=1516159 RepID=UPI002284E115|nr:hypothetical protein [Vibrio coralliirubri]MCY9864979.1 hypothetical protein [Vibrio coralliirubri]
MASKNAAFYSCKFNRSETIKSHRTLEAAIKAAGDFGMVFDKGLNIERQVHRMANNQLSSFAEGSRSHESMDFKFSDELLKLGLIVK